MKALLATLWAESLKSRKSNIFWITVFAFMIFPLMMGFLMWVSKNPELAGKLGLIGAKARLFTETDWQAYFQLFNMIVAAIGLIGFGFVTSWVFGREYADRTLKDLLALPVSRSTIVLSKFLIVFLWCILLSLVLFVFGILSGVMIHISGWSRELAIQNAYVFSGSSLFTMLLCTPVAFFASYGRGYMSPMGFVILTLILAEFSGTLGFGPYFPWAIPGLYSSTAGVEGIQLGTVSYIILFSASAVGFIATFAWWHYADQT